MSQTTYPPRRITRRQFPGLAALLPGILGSVLLTPASWGQAPRFQDELKPIEPQPLPLELESPASQPPPTIGSFDSPEGYAPAPYDARNSRQFNLYRLDIGDGVSVNVRDYPEFNFGGPIDPEGNIRVPFLGKLPLVGLTLEEVEAKVAYELGRRYLREEPEVIASLAGTRPAQITVLGEIVRPGYYSVAPGTPLTSVLQIVGGSSSWADLRSVIVRRQLVDGTVLEEKVDLYTPLIKGEKLPDFRLQGGDAVFVSRLEAGQDQGYDRVLLAKTTLVKPTITIRVIAPSLPIGVALRNLTLQNGSTYLDALSSLPVEVPLLTREEVILMRFDPTQGKVLTQSLNRIKAVENQDLAQFMPLLDDDVIVISRSLYGKILEAFNIITQPIRDLLGWSSFFYNLPNRFDNFDFNNNRNFNNNTFGF